MYELFKPFACAHLGPDLGFVETVDADFERVKPLFLDQIVYPIVEAKVKESSPIIELINGLY